jgi:hypothetical protein
MGLETGTYINDLVVTNPVDGDPKSQGDDHLRLIKGTLKDTFTNVTGAVTASHTEINWLDGLTSAALGTDDLAALPAAIGTTTPVAGTFTDVVVDSLIIEDSSAVDLANGIAPLVVELASGQHLEMDGNEIQAKSNETTAARLNINRQGGNLFLGPQFGTGEIRGYHDGSQVFETLADGLSILGVLANDGPSGGNQDAQYRYTDSAGNVVGFVGFPTSPDLYLDNQVYSGWVRLRGRNSAGAATSLILADPDGEVWTYRQGVQSFGTYPQGIQVRPSSGAVDNEVRISLLEAGGTVRANLGYLTGDALVLQNSVTNGGIELHTGSETALVANENSSLDMYYDNTVAVRTVAGGLAIGSGGNDGQFRAYTITSDPEIDGLTGGSNFGALVEGEIGGHLVVGVRGNDGSDSFAVLDTNDGGDVAYARKIFQVKTGAETILYHDGSQKAATSATGLTVTGNIAADNVGQTVSKAADEAVTNNTLQDDDHLTLSLSTAGIYTIDMLIRVTGQNAADLRIAFTVSNLTDGMYTYQVTNTGGLDAGDSSDDITATQVVNVIADSISHWVQLSGYVDVSAASTIQFRWAQDVTNAAPTTIHKGSWLKAEKVS